MSTFSGSPTNPRSMTFSMLESGSTTVRLTLRACTMLPSLPHSPMALPPAALMKPTICLLIEPASTISTISTVFASVMRKPAANSDLMPSFLSMASICGPPPCTTTGLIAVCSSRTMSLRKVARHLLLAHGVAAIFHHDGLLVVALHVWQRFGQDAGLGLRVDLGRFAHRFGLVRLPAVLADAAVPRQCTSSFFPRAAGRWPRAVRECPCRHARRSREPSEMRPAAWRARLRLRRCGPQDRRVSPHRILVKTT